MNVFFVKDDAIKFIKLWIELNVIFKRIDP